MGQPKCRKQKLKLMPPPLRKSKAPSGRRKKKSMGPKSKRQKMAPMVPETEPQLKKMELVKKRKVRAKKTWAKKPKEKREKKRKMVRAKKKRKEMTKFLFLLSPNLVISYYIYQIRHLIIISALLTKKRGKKRSTASVRNIPQSNGSKNAQKSLSNARNARPILPLKKTTEHLVRKRTKILPRDGVFSQKNKKESFLPPLKTKQTKISLIKSNEKNKNFALFCSCEFVLEINTPEEKNEKKNLKVELKEKKMVFERIKHFDLEYVY